MKITVKYIPNILEKGGRKKRCFLSGGRRLSARTYIKRSGFSADGMRVIINGERIDHKRLGRVVLKDGDEAIITPDIKVPVIAFLAVGTTNFSIVSWAAVIKLAALNVFKVISLLSAGYSIYSAFKKPKVPNFGTSGSGLDENSPSAAWDGSRTTQEFGLAIPVTYGRARVSGQILNQYVSTDGDKSYLNLLISAGQGPINSISSIRFNKNPIENYEGITTVFREGTGSDAIIPGFEDIHNEYNINVNLAKDNPHTYTMINDDVEAFVITFHLPAGLFQTNSSTGAYTPWSVTYKVEYKLSTSGTWIDLGNTTINAKSRTAIRRTFRKDGLSSGRYDIRVTRLSDDSSADFSKTGDMSWLLIDEIQTDDLIYPFLAKLGIKALALDQLQGSRPEVDFLDEGRKVSVPDIRDGGTPVAYEDYYWDPVTEEYKLFSDDTVLSWDGLTYVDAWSANPVWCVMDMLTNNRYGLGDIMASADIPLAEYVRMSQICDEKVDNGASGYEKKYRLDVHVDSQSRASDVLMQLAAVFDAFYFPLENSARFKIDEDEDPVQLFGMGNTYGGKLQQSWKSRREMYHIVDVQYLNKDKDYETDYASVVDNTAVNEAIAKGEEIRRHSMRVHSVGASYAYRQGLRALKVSRNINRIFSFKAGIDSIAVAPGDVAGFAHDTPGIAFSGRIKSGSTTTSIKLDRQVTIESGKTYKILMQFSDDDRIEERTVNNSPGSTDTITISSALTAAPIAYDKYSFGEQGIHYKKMRVTGYSIDSELDVDIVASEMSSNVYDDSAPVVAETNYSLLSRDVQLITDLALTEMVIKAGDGSIINTIEVWFRRPVDSTYILNKFFKSKIFLSEDNGDSWQFVGETYGEHFVLNEGIETGSTYKIAVVSVSRSGLESSVSSSPQDSITIQGKAAPPSNVTGFDVSQRGSYLHFSWDPIPDGDLARYEIRKGADWAAGQTIAEKVDVTEFDYPVGAIGEQTYMIKAIDTSGNESVAPASDTITVVPPPDGNFALQLDVWASNREYKLTNIDRAQMNLYDPSYTRDVFILKTGDTFEGDDISAIDLGNQAIAAAGTIEQFDAIDLGVIFEFNLLTDLLFQNVTGGSMTIEVSASEDGTTWSAFAEVDPQENYRARYLKFKFTLESDTVNQVFFYACTIYVNVPTPKIFYFRDVAIAIGGTVINLRDDFTQTPRVRGLTVTNGVLGVPHITAMDEDSMTIKVWDPVGSAYIGTAEVSGEVVGQ